MDAEKRDKTRQNIIEISRSTLFIFFLSRVYWQPKTGNSSERARESIRRSDGTVVKVLCARESQKGE